MPNWLPDVGEILATKETAWNGRFEIEGNAVGRAKHDIESVVTFYHRCDDDDDDDAKNDLAKVILK